MFDVFVNPAVSNDSFLVAYGAKQDATPKDTEGAVLRWSLDNPARPEHILLSPVRNQDLPASSRCSQRLSVASHAAPRIPQSFSVVLARAQFYCGTLALAYVMTLLLAAYFINLDFAATANVGQSDESQRANSSNICSLEWIHCGQC